MLSTTDLASLPNRPPAQDTPDTPSTASIKLRSMPSPSKQPEIVAVQAPPRLSQRPTIHFRGSETDSSPPSVIYESRQSPVRGRDWKRITSFAVLCLANLLCAIDGSIVSVALPVIAAALQGSALQAFWAGTSFLLASALCQPLWAELAPLFGQKTLLLVALACFTTGTCLAVLATNFPFLLTARSMQGVGVGGILALTYTIVANLVSLR
ncbi:major facilitator superfamily domain-containing protein, partial [Hypoxylon rubiginosum]